VGRLFDVAPAEAQPGVFMILRACGQDRAKALKPAGSAAPPAKARRKKTS